MDGVAGVIVGTMLSGIVSSFVLAILNNKMWSAFQVIQEDLYKLTNKTRSALKFSGFILMILITVQFATMFHINSFESGLILGFLQSIKDTCFGENIVENKMKQRKNNI